MITGKPAACQPIALSFLLFILSFTGVFGQSTSWKGTTSTAWNNSVNWTNGVPSSSIDVIIGDASFTGLNQPTVNQKASCKSLTIGGAVASTLTISRNITVSGAITINSNGTVSHGGANLTLTGNWSNSGTYSFTGNKSKVFFSGTSQTLGGSSSSGFRQLIINSTDTVTLSANISVTSTLTVNGIFDPASFTVTASGSPTLNVSSGATLRVKTLLFSGNYSGFSNANIITNAGSLVEYSGTINQTISNVPTYSSLIIRGAGTTKTLAGNLPSLYSADTTQGKIFVFSGTLNLSTFTANRGTTVTGGLLQVANGAQLNIGANNYPTGYHTVSFSANSTVEYNGTSTQTISAETYGNLIFSGGAAKTMPVTAFTIFGNFSTTGSGTTFTAGNAITVVGNVDLATGTTFSAGSFTHTISGNWTNAGTYTGSSSTLLLNGAAKNISGSGTNNFNNLTISGVGLTTSGTVTISCAGNLTTQGSGTFTHLTGTLTMSGTSKAIAGSGLIFNNLALSGSISSSASYTITGDLSIGGSLTSSGGTVTLSGTSNAISGAGSKTFSGLSISGTYTTAVSLTVSNNLTIIGGFTASAGTVTFSGISTFSGTANLYKVVVNATSFSPGTGSTLGVSDTLTLTAGLSTSANIPNSISFNGSGSQIIPTGTYYNLITATGGTKTVTGSIAVNGSVTIGTGTTLSTGSQTVDVFRNWINNGTLNAGTSTVTFIGQVSTISGANSFNTLVINKTSQDFYLSLLSNTTAATVTVTSGFIQTNNDTLTITNTRTGAGYIYGNIQRNQAFTTGVNYAFEGADNYINFSSVSSVTSITISVYPASSVTDYSNNAAINRYYNITIPSGTYVATLRLHYQDIELNGNNESALDLKRYDGVAWTAQTPTGSNTSSNYYEKSALTDITNRWTLAGAENVVAWTGSSSTDWATAGNWTIVSGSPNTPPQNDDIVLLGDRAFSNHPSITTSVTVKSIVFKSTTATTLSIGSGGSLAIAGNISGEWSGNATHSLDVNAQTLTVGSELVLSDGTNGHEINLTSNGGTITISGGIYQAGASAVTLSGSSALNIGGEYQYTTGTFSAGSGSTVTYNGTGFQTIAPLTYHHLDINKADGIAKAADAFVVNGDMNIVAGELDLDNTLSIAGDFTQALGTVFYYDNTAATITLQGDFTNNGSIIPTSSTFVFSGTNAQQVSGGTFNNLTINKTSGTVTLLGNAVVANNFTITSGTLNLSTFTANRTQIGGELTIADAATIQVSGANTFPQNFATYTLGSASNTLYDGTIAQTIKDIVYGNLTLSNGGANAKTLNQNTTVNGDLTINSGATFSTGSYGFILNGNWTNNGTFDASTGSVSLGGTGKTLDGTTTFNDLTVTGSYTVNNVNLNFNGTAEITGTFATGSGTMTVSGDMINRGVLSNTGVLTFTGNQTQTLRLVNAVSSVASGITNFNGSVAPILSSNSSPVYGVLNINNTAGITPSVSWTIVGAFTVASGSTFTGGPYTHSFLGSFTNNGTFTTTGTTRFNPSTSVNINFGTGFTSTGIVDFSGSGLITLSGTPTKLTNVSVTNINASGVTPNMGWTLEGDFSLSGGSVFNASSFTDNLSGSFTSNGTLNGQTSTFVFKSTSGIIQSNDLTALNNIIINTGSIIEAHTDVNLTGDFTKNGTYTLTSNALSFTGSGNSILSASSYPLRIGYISVEKTVQSAMVTLSGNLDSVGTLAVMSGILNAGTVSITEESGLGEFNVDSLATYFTSRTSAPSVPTFTTYTLANYSNIEYGATSGTQAIITSLTYGNLVLSGSGGTKSAGAAITVNNNFTLSGATFTGGSFTHNIGGNWTMGSGTFTNTGTTINFNGTDNQTVNSTGNFNNIIVNKSAGVILLSSNVTLGTSSVFTLTGGVVSTRSNNLIVTNTATAAITRTSGWVNGNLRRSLPGSGTNQTYSFFIGDSLNYSPVSTTFASLTGTGTLTAVATNTEHPQISTSGISSAKSVNRYYTFTNSGTTFTTYGATFTFVSGDLDAGVTTGNLIVAKYSGSTWSLPTTSGTSSTTASISSASSFSDFIIGESSAKVWTGGASTLNWNDANNWSPTGVPVLSDSVTITNNSGVVLVNTTGATNSLLLNNASGFGLQITSGNSLTVGGILTPSTAGIDINGQTLTLNGSFSGSGTGSLMGSATSNLIIGGNGAFGAIRMNQTGSGSTNMLNNFTFNRASSGTLSLGNQMQVIGVATHTAGTLTTGNNLILRATGAIAYGQIAGTGSGDINGNVTAEFYIPASSPGKWRNIASPFTTNTLADLTDDLLINTGTPSYSYINVFRLDESLGGASAPGAWQAITSTSQSMDNEGLAIYQFSENFISAVTMDLTGTYTKSDYTTPSLTRTGALTDTTGYHLIRNPWPSNYLHNTTVTNLVSNTIYIYDGQTVRDYNGSTGSLVNGTVPPFHAIMVEINSNGNTLTLPTANRNTSNSANYHDKTGLMDYVALKVTNSAGDWDETRIYTDNKAQNGKDYWDANKILNGNDVPSIYTLADGNKTSINLLNTIPTEGITIPVNFSSRKEGLHTISFTSENIGQGTDLFLQDYKTVAIHNIATGDYTFTHAMTNTPNRFALHYGDNNLQTGTPILEQTRTFVYAADGKLVINTSLLTSETIVDVVDVLGKTIYKGVLAQHQQVIDFSGIPTQYLFIRITNGSRTEVFKTLLQ